MEGAQEVVFDSLLMCFMCSQRSSRLTFDCSLLSWFSTLPPLDERSLVDFEILCKESVEFVWGVSGVARVVVFCDVALRL